jgi:fluoride ion exporter CrcB/FEX
MWFYLCIAIAGGSGAVLRYLLGRTTVNIGLTALPFGTLIANVLGCFLMGNLSWTIVQKWQLSKETQTVAWYVIKMAERKPPMTKRCSSFPSANSLLQCQIMS